MCIKFRLTLVDELHVHSKSFSTSFKMIWIETQKNNLLQIQCAVVLLGSWSKCSEISIGVRLGFLHSLWSLSLTFTSFFSTSPSLRMVSLIIFSGNNSRTISLSSSSRASQRLHGKTYSLDPCSKESSLFKIPSILLDNFIEHSNVFSIHIMVTYQ